VELPINWKTTYNNALVKRTCVELPEKANHLCNRDSKYMTAQRNFTTGNSYCQLKIYKFKLILYILKFDRSKFAQLRVSPHVQIAAIGTEGG